VTTEPSRGGTQELSLGSRVGHALRARHNWIQLIQFSLVGGSGFLVNLAVYTFALDYLHIHYLAAATLSFLVAASNNYLWNRIWTFRDQRGHLALQGIRFFVVSALAYGTNLLFLSAFVHLGLGKVVAQVAAIVLVTPVNFIGNKLWSFRT
jgi:putative flippase GtrA